MVLDHVRVRRIVGSDQGIEDRCDVTLTISEDMLRIVGWAWPCPRPVVPAASHIRCFEPVEIVCENNTIALVMPRLVLSTGRAYRHQGDEQTIT